MNSDKSQQPVDNWVQKRVRNLEGMNRARHISADQGDEKPNQNYLFSKRNSAPGPLSRRGSLPRSVAREKQTTGLRPSIPSKSRSISPISVYASQIAVKTTKTETVKPEPPVRKSSLTSPNRLVSTRLLQFQPSLPDSEKSIKPCSLSKTDSSQDMNGTLPVKKVPSPTEVANGNAMANSPKRTPDGRPPRSSGKTTNGLSGKSSVSKVPRSKVASSSHYSSKPSVKPKPAAVSVASASKTKSDLRTPSRPNSAQTTGHKSPVHSSLRQPSGRKTTKSKSPVPKLPHSVSTSTSTAEANGVKCEEKSARPKHPLHVDASKMDSHTASKFKRPLDGSKTLDGRKTIDGSKLPVSQSYGSPKVSRKQFGSAKSSTTTKSAIRTPSRASSVPVPKKPKPPPVLAPKPVLNEIPEKAKGIAESSIPLQQPGSTVSADTQKEAGSLPEIEVPVRNKPNQETLSSTETATVIESTLESKENITTLNMFTKSEAIDNGDENIYDDVIHLPNTVTKISSKGNSTEDDALLNTSEVNVKDHSTGDIGDDTVHPVEVDIPAKSATKDDERDSKDLAEINANSNDAGMKIPRQPIEENKDDLEESRGETNSLPLVQQSPVSLVMVNQQKEEHTAMHTDDDIYDDVVQNTIVSLQEKVVNDVSSNNQNIVTSATVAMETSNLRISMDKQSLSAEIQSIPAKSEPCDITGHGAIKGQTSKTPSPHHQTQLTENEAFYDDVVHPVKLSEKKKSTFDKLPDEDFQVAELCVSPRQSRVASFQRAGDKNFGYRDSGLGIEAYYDKIDRSDDVIAEPAFYDQIGEGREQLETISSTEDVLQSESSTENVLVVTDLEPPPLPPRSEDLIKEINESKSNLTGSSLEVSTKVTETTTAESGFEDQCFDGEASKDMPARIASKAKPDPLVITKPYDNSPPPLPPRRPQSTQLDTDDVPLRSPGYLSQRASSGSPQLLLLPQRKTSAPQLPSSPKDFLSSTSSLAPSHSAVSIISGRSEDRYPTDGGSDVSSLVDVGGDFTTSEHKKEKSKFSLGIFSRKKSDRKKKADTAEDFEHARPRASSMGQSLHRKKSSRHAIKKKGSVPPEMQFLPTDADYSLPDPLYFTDDKNYDDCTVIKNNWKSPPPDSKHSSSNFSTEAAPLSTTVVSSNELGPKLIEIQGTEHSELNKNKDIQKSMESLGSFTQNFEDSSGWFDDIYDMVADSTTYIAETSEVKLTVTAENNDDTYDTVAPDLLPDKGKLVVTDSPKLNTTSNSIDSSGSFDSIEEDEDDHLSPLNSEFSDTLRGNSLPQCSIRTKVTSPARPRSCSNVNQTVEIVKNLQISRSLRPAEDIQEDVMETTLVYADAVWDYDPTQDGDLKFHANDVIEVMDMTNDDWWLGYVNDSSGWFPASYVRIRVGQEEEVESSNGNEGTRGPQLQRVDSNEGSLSASGRSFRRTVRRASSDGILDKKLSRSEYRAKIVDEIVSTERTYVKYLEDVVEGYMQRCIAYPRLFTPDRIEVIFGNMVDLLKFQKIFLLKLEACVTPADLSKSQIGTVFIDHETDFNVYSEYCNNHPYAVNEMNELQEDPQFMLFFESCRLLRNLGDLPLEAFLLKPVQKICKYPLQLSELLKYTDPSHPDYGFVKNAVESMKNVASLINSRKRRIENLYKLALWQKAIENWKGDHVVETSSEEIFSGDLQKISKGHSQERHFTLFDHQLVYCKREAISHKLQYRGRIIMDNCKIIDLADGEEIYGGNPVKNAWKINNETKNKWYVLYSKDPSIKEAWMDAFKRERQRVQDDAISKFNIPSRLRKMAIAQADKSNKKEIKTKRTVLQESIDQHSIKQRSSVFQASPNTPKKKGSKKKKTKRSAV